MRDQELTMTNPVSGLAELEAAIQSERFLDVRRRIFRQLIESLIYEGVIEPGTEPAGERQIFHLTGRDAVGSPISYRCLGRRRFSFDRVRLESEPVMRVVDGVAAEATSLSQFLVEIRELLGDGAERLARCISELEQTLLKDTLAQYRRDRDGKVLRGAGHDDVETGVLDGHPYHPAYKSRMGFDYLDNAAYGPDFGPAFQPIWLAVHRQWTRGSASRRIDPLAFIRQELGEVIYERFTGEIHRRGYDPGDYLFMPVHPWQWREQVVTSLFPDLRDGLLIPLGTAGDSYRPQQSIRTLTNITTSENASLKLSLSIVNTSTSRILAPHTVENAPRITDWLQGIARDDRFLREESRPVLLGEVLGAAYDPPSFGLEHPSATYGILSCIWRESIHPYLAPDEEAVPWTALCHIDTDGHPFIMPWIHDIGVGPWVRRLLEVSIPPVIHYLYAYGIAFEAHAQNMTLIHHRGIPTRVALKDFHDGVRFAPAYLSPSHPAPDLTATPVSHARVNRNSYLQTDNPREVRDFMHDAFFFINLSELALFLADHYGLDEERFWSLARSVISGYQCRFPGFGERFTLFNLFEPTIHVEQLTKRRLFPETEVRLHRVRNALALVEGEPVRGR